MTEEHRVNVAVFVLGALKWLKDNNLITNDPGTLTPKGIAMFDELEASGWRPPEEDVRQYLTHITCNRIKPEVMDATVTLISGWDQTKEMVRRPTR